MPADVIPQTWLGTGYTNDSTAHTISLVTYGPADGSAIPSNKVLAGLNDTEANATAGDIRKVAFEFCEAIYQAWLTQIAVPNQPVEMTINRSSFESSTGDITRTYTMQFVVASSGPPDVIDEP